MTDVEAFLASLDHPFKKEILALRQIVLGLASDRATVKFRDGKDVRARRAAFANVIREWIRRV